MDRGSRCVKAVISAVLRWHQEEAEVDCKSSQDSLLIGLGL